MMQGHSQWGPMAYNRAPIYDDFYNGFDEYGNRGQLQGNYNTGGFNEPQPFGAPFHSPAPYVSLLYSVKQACGS